MKLVVDDAETFVYSGAHEFDSSLPTVLFLHGAGGDHSVWALQSRYFAHHGWNALAVDLPGHGRSAGLPPPSIAAIAAWAVRMLDTLGVERAAWIGHSMGSLAALEAAARFPDRVTRLGLLAPAVPMTVNASLLDAARDDTALAIALITGWSFSPAHQLASNPQPGMWLTGSGARLLERAGPGVLHAGLSACNEYDNGLVAAAAVRCPTLLLMGERDLMAPRKSTVSLAAALSLRTVISVEGSGHSLMSEAPDAVLDALRDFLAIEAPAPGAGRNEVSALRPRRASA